MTRPRDGGATKKADRKQRQLVHVARREVELRRTVEKRDHNPAEVLQEALDTLVAELRFSQSLVDELDRDGLFVDTIAGKVPHHLIRLRNLYLDKVANCAKDMVRLDLVDRHVRVEEAQAILVAQAVRQAMEDVGLEPDQVTAVGQRLRELSQRTAVIEDVD